MTESSLKMRTANIWKQKSDEELIAASENLSNYTEEAEEIIRSELQRRNLPEPESTVRTIDDGQNKQPINSVVTGIIILIIGIALIIISPSLTDLSNKAKFGGVALLIVGGFIAAVSFSQFIKTQPTTPPASTIQSVSPKSVELGNTPDEVQLVMGNPDKIINLGAQVIHVYKDMKIIYVDGKVSDVQLS